MKVGAKVWNKMYGEGKIMGINGETIMVWFSQSNYFLPMTRDRLHIT